MDAEAVVARLRVTLGRIERRPHSRRPVGTRATTSSGRAARPAKALPQRTGPKPAHLSSFLLRLHSLHLVRKAQTRIHAWTRGRDTDTGCRGFYG